MHLALQLAEIRLKIACYLERKDLRQCMLVCHDWWLTFEPFICHDVRVSIRHGTSIFGPQGPPSGDDMDNLSYEQDPSVPRQPSAISLIRHRKQVYSLYYNYEFYHVQFSNLRHLTLVSHSFSGQMDNWRQFLRGCENSLQDIELWGYRDLPEAEFWDTLASLPNIKSLLIQNGWLCQLDSTLSFWKMCTKLESLKLKGTTFSQSAMEKYPLPNLSNLRELVFIRIYMQFNLQARIVAQCNQLKRLLWKTSASYAIPDEPLVCTFKDFIVSGQLSKIESVLIDASQCAILGEVFSKLMDLTNYNLISGKLWDPRIAATIRDYLPNLTEVNVDLDIDEGGQLVLMLLISCPQLHTVVTSLIKASDMMVLYPQRWACNGLKRFSVFFELDEVPGVLYEESNQFIMKQLSALTELEILLLNGGRYYKSETPAEGVLSICLASGMDILAELNSLRGVALPGHQPWTKAEIDWVADHWRRLTQLAGINKFNLVAEQGLEEELIRRGIRSKLYGDDFDELYPPHLLTVFSFY